MYDWSRVRAMKNNANSRYAREQNTHPAKRGAQKMENK